MTERRELVIVRWYEAPRERVFDALVNPSLLARWMGPRGSTVERCEVDARVNGKFRFGLNFGGTGVVLTGVYRQVENPARLAFSWGVEGSGDDSEVTVQLEPLRGGTSLLLTHFGLTPEDFAQNDAGWRELFDRLAEALGVSSGPA